MEEEYIPGKLNDLAQFKLPNTLLREPLDQKKILQLSKKERRMYNLQKQKYETGVKSMQKKADDGKNPKDHVFTLLEAKCLIEGEFHVDDEDED